MSSTDHPFDRGFEAMKHPVRRRVFLALSDDNPMQVDDVGESPEPTDVHDIVTDGEEKIALIHVHLPKLADADLIDWDRANRIVRRGPNWEEIQPLIQLINGHRERLPDTHT